MLAPSAGDVFLITTDGVNETASEDGHEFGLDRLRQFLEKDVRRPLPALSADILAAVNAFGPSQDDRTLLLVRIL